MGARGRAKRPAELNRAGFSTNLSRIACLLAPLFGGACTPVLRAPDTAGVGVFWDVEIQKDRGVLHERYEGVGLLWSSRGVFLGWAAVDSVEVDPVLSPSGIVQVGERQYAWGPRAEEAADQVTTMKGLR